MTVAAVRAGLTEPLRVAVAGRSKAGKSTLVNALLGTRVAPTDATECTKVVTWFRYGSPDRAEVVLRDGSRRGLRLRPDGFLPRDLGVDPSEVESLDVWLTIGTLRSFTLIDTPGLGSADESSSKATERLIAVDAASRSAAARAEALAFLLNQVVREDDVRALRAFRLFSTGIRNSAVNAIGVLNKVDLLGEGDRDPWDIGVELASRHTKALRGEVAFVLPLIGLLAETTMTGHLTERDAAQLTTLAAALDRLDPVEQELALCSADSFLAWDGPVPPEGRDRLLRILGLFGLRRAVALVQSGSTTGAALRRALEELSGVTALREALATTFARRADALKADYALNALRNVAGRGRNQAQLVRLRDAVEALRLDPAMHELNELRVVQQLASGEVSLPDGLVRELHRLVEEREAAAKLGMDGAPAAELGRAALEGAGRWRELVQTSLSPRQAHVAQVVNRSYQLLWEQLGDGARMADGR